MNRNSIWRPGGKETLESAGILRPDELMDATVGYNLPVVAFIHPSIHPPIPKEISLQIDFNIHFLSFFQVRKRRPETQRKFPPEEEEHKHPPEKKKS